MESRRPLAPHTVRDELEKILASATFASANRSQRFLRYVVESSLKENDEPPKEYAVAMEVFDRDSSYDPAIDATVRVEAGRLRSRLRDYYADAGRNDPVIIEIPRGAYRATFSERASQNGSAETVPSATAPPPNPVSPAPAKRSPGLIIRSFLWGLAAVLAIIAILGTVELYRNRHHTATLSTNPPHVLAVLPFENKTGVAANNYLTEGLTDNLIRQLSELPHLRVVSRAAADHANRQTAARELGATVLLTGELRLNPDGRLVLNSELSNARDGTVLKSSQYLPDESDLRPIQSDIVQDLIGGLGLTLDARESAGVLRPLTTSPAAFQDFLRGESAMLNGDEASLVTAVQLFEDAVKKDSSFAQAYTAMSGAHLLIALYFELPGKHAELARQYSERAIALDPTITEAHGVLGLVHLTYDWNFEAAQTELMQADSREDAIWKLGCTAHLLYASGNRRHAEEDLLRMLEFNPGSVMLVSEMGCINYYAGRYDDSVRYYRQALATAPWAVLANWELGRSLCREGKYGEALQLLKIFDAHYGTEQPLVLGEIGYIQALSRDRKAAHVTIQRLEFLSRSRFVDPYYVAEIYHALNDRNSTYAWLDKAYTIRSPFLVSLASDPKWSSEQADPRFQQLWNRMTASGGHSASSSQTTAGN